MGTDKSWIDKLGELQRLAGDYTVPNGGWSAEDLERAKNIFENLGQTPSWPQEMLDMASNFSRMWNTRNLQPVKRAPDLQKKPANKTQNRTGIRNAPIPISKHKELYVDISERSRNMILTAYAPGIKSKSDISVKVSDDTIRITAKAYAHSVSGKPEEPVLYSRLIRLPAKADADSTQIDYSNDYLCIYLNKQS